MTVQGDQWRQSQGTGGFLTDTLMDTMYLTSTLPNNTVGLNTLDSFNTTSQTWANITITGGNFNTIGGWLSSAATSSTSGLGLGFTIGGADSRTPPGMVVLDASNPNDLSWTNKTEGAPPLCGAEMQYARYGNKGVLIAFGGYIDVGQYSEI